MKFMLSLVALVLGMGVAQAQEKGLASIYNDAFHGRTTASKAKYDKNAKTASHRTLPFGTKVRITLLSTKKSVDVVINDRCKVADKIVELSRKAATDIGLDKIGTGQVSVVILGKESEQKATASTNVKPNANTNNTVARSTTNKTTVSSSNKPASSTKPSKKTTETPKIAVIGEASKMETGGLYKMQVLKLENQGYGVQVAGYSDYETVVKQVSVLQKNWFKGALVFVDKLNGKPYYKVILGPFYTKEEADSYKNNIRKKYDMKDAFVVDLKALSEKAKAK
ncbi:MAG: septal ring lytic transglycosylase RlpA family protein [Saprospiraceae bacterium]|nr:septal ring lytic transglycosylase RlpA family protein [Saprospiraceae bacterium]